jgi:ApaG protein|tara:strand:+ start:934 stop:1371 length:438 start_codon:yes stop_codon:yes gene_type:complete
VGEVGHERLPGKPMPDTSVHSSEAVTNGIRVTVTSRFSHAETDRQRWYFTFTVRIANEGAETVQLVTRHWIITNGSNEIQEVKGPGVLGHKPTLVPGQAFEYTSGCPLGTPFGSMRGTYQMVTSSGTEFDAEIAEFALTEPYTVH